MHRGGPGGRGHSSLACGGRGPCRFGPYGFGSSGFGSDGFVPDGFIPGGVCLGCGCGRCRVGAVLVGGGAHLDEYRLPGGVGGQGAHHLGRDRGAVGQLRRIRAQPEQRVDVDEDLQQMRTPRRRRTGRQRTRRVAAFATQEPLPVQQRHQRIRTPRLARTRIITTDAVGEFVDQRQRLGTLEVGQTRREPLHPVVTLAGVHGAVGFAVPLPGPFGFLRRGLHPRRPHRGPQRPRRELTRRRQHRGIEHAARVVAGLVEHRADRTDLRVVDLPADERGLGVGQPGQPVHRRHHLAGVGARDPEQHRDIGDHRPLGDPVPVGRGDFLVPVVPGPLHHRRGGHIRPLAQLVEFTQRRRRQLADGLGGGFRPLHESEHVF